MKMIVSAVVVLLAITGFGHAQAPAPPPEATTAAPAASAAPAAAASPAPQAPEWTYARYMELAKATGRKMDISEDAFKQVQERREKVIKRIEEYLTGKFKAAQPEVMQAFKDVPREYYHYNYEGKFNTVAHAYDAEAKPWGLGYGSVMSDYLGQAYMTQLAEPKATDVVLEIGTGSGFQISLLSRIVKEAYSIEIIEPIGKGVAELFAPIGYTNVHSKVGDGYFGWPEVTGGFDIIMVTCAARYVPPALLDQLKPNGKLIIPVGSPIRGTQTLFVYTKDTEGKVHSRRDVGVHFIPMKGAVEKTPKPGS
jgi:protein-L-isoaspartate(D-aspartate) O-methyltransferase